MQNFNNPLCGVGWGELIAVLYYCTVYYWVLNKINKKNIVQSTEQQIAMLILGGKTKIIRRNIIIQQSIAS